MADWWIVTAREECKELESGHYDYIYHVEARDIYEAVSKAAAKILWPKGKIISVQKEGVR